MPPQNREACRLLARLNGEPTMTAVMDVLSCPSAVACDRKVECGQIADDVFRHIRATRRAG